MRSVLLLGLLSLAAVPGAAQDPADFQPYAERPGQLEFSGRLCARPLQLEEALARGLGADGAAALREAALRQLEAYPLYRRVEATDEFLIEVGEAGGENLVAERLLASGAFEYVEPDWICYPVGCPNDSQFGQQWQHTVMESCAGWDVEIGDPNVVVAICDTGIETGHPDLQLHRREAFNAVTATWESNGGQITPVHPHGTNTTGCAAANGNNGQGVAGVCWNVGHRMMRVSDDSSGSSAISTLTLAARTAAEAGDKVANVSYSGVASATVDSTGAYVRSLGALLVWSGGNSSENHTFSRDDNVLIVGASNPSDAKTSWSAFGNGIDFLAPGEGVRTTNTGGGYASVSGTSFSAPLTAGLCGLIWSANPGLSPQEVEDIIRTTCDDLGSPGVDSTHGYGRINVRRALEQAAQAVNISLLDEALVSVDPAGGQTLRFQVSAGTGTPAGGTGQFWLDTGSGWFNGPCAETAPGVYTATFPPIGCGSDVSYYFSADDTSGQDYFEPAGAPASAYEAASEVVVVAVDDEVESSNGWVAGVAGDTATTGQWTFGNPIGTDAQPENDHTPTGANCFFTGQGSNGGSVGENDVDGGETTLLSPSYDLSGLSDPTFSYWRWYSNSAGASPNADTFTVDISDDGGSTWTTVEVVGPTGNEVNGGWIQHQFQAASLISLTNQVRLRFRASDLGSGSIVEAAIDDLRVEDRDCATCGAVTYCSTSPNSVGNGALMASFGSASVSANDLELNAFALPANRPGLFYFGPNQVSTPLGDGIRCVGGQIKRFGAMMTDSFGFVSLQVDVNSALLATGPAAALPGNVTNFQFWYRDPAAGGSGQNLSNGLSVTWCP